MPYNNNDTLQRFGNLKVEAVSFTISEPVEDLDVSPMLYDLASDEQKRILESTYEVKPFLVQTITLERIFVDKLFAAEAYVRNASVLQRAFEAAKHIYDLAVMEDHPKIIQLMSDPKQMERLVAIRMKEERNRLDGIPGVAPAEFIFFSNAGNNANVRNAYEIMQSQYLVRASDQILFYEATSSLLRIQEKLQNNLAWRNCRGQIEDEESHIQTRKASPNNAIQIFPAQPDRVYRGKVLEINGDQIIQEISPGLAISHDAKTLTGITNADIGKHLSIAYDRTGAATVTEGKHLDRGNEIDR